MKNDEDGIKKSILQESSDDENEDLAIQFDGEVSQKDHDQFVWKNVEQQKQEIHNSQYKQQYLQQMSKVSNKISLQQIGSKYQHQLISHNIQFNPAKYLPIQIRRIDSTINSQIASYNVNVSYFQLNISILNLDFPFLYQHTVQSLGSGSFGNVYLLEVYEKRYAAKNVMFEEAQNFKGNQQQTVYQTVIQYCIGKICSALEVGLSMETVLGFDLICYSNCIQFFMQCGQPIQQITAQSKQRLLYNLSIIHTIQLIHNDIKPSNIMYSPTYNHNVFIDYGISQFIKQTIGQQSKVTFKGSYNYTLSEMKYLLSHKLVGYVDLYFNDLNALKISVKEFENVRIIKFSQQQLSYKNAYNQGFPIKDYHDSIIVPHQKRQDLLNMSSLVNLILTVYCLFTQKPYKQVTLETIQQSIKNPETFYLSLADIITELFPSSLIYQYFKKFIKPLLIEKHIDDHPLFDIYKESYFVPWLKEDQKKEKKFQSRLNTVEQMLDYHLIVLSKPATIDSFLRGFSLKSLWKEKISYYICYLDFISRNCIKGKEYLVSRMYQLIDEKKEPEKDRTKENGKQPCYNHSQQYHLNIDYKNYQILCHIYQELPHDQLIHHENLWLAAKLLDLFQNFSDYQKTLSLYDLIKSHSLSRNHKVRCFKYTLDIFAHLQRNPSPRYFPEMRKKIKEMHEIRKSIQMDGNFHSHFNLFITSILIKISEFFMEAAEFTTLKDKQQKIQLLQHKINEIQIQLKDQGLTQKSTISKIVIHKVYQAQFVLAHLKHEFYQVIYYGNLIIDTNKHGQSLGPNKFISQNITNMMAEAYLQLGYLENSKMCIYQDLTFQVEQNFYSNFASQWIRFKINILENNFEKAQVNMYHLRRISNDKQKEISFVNHLITFHLKFCDQFPSKQLQHFVLAELEKYFVKIKEWPLKMQENVQTFKVLMILQKLPHLTEKQFAKGLISYRNIVGRVVEERLLAGEFEKLKIEDKIRKGLKQYFESADQLATFPPPSISSFLPQLFFTIHLKYYELYHSQQTIQNFYQLSTQLYPFTYNLISLQLWINYYKFKVNHQKTESETNALFHNLSQILDFIFFSKRQLPLIQKHWYKLFFLYDLNLSHQTYQFNLSLNIITQITHFIRNSANPNLFTMLHFLAKYFLSIISTMDKIDIFLHKMQLQNLTLPQISEFSIFLLPLYQRILNASPQNFESYDRILFQIIRSVKNLPLKAKILLKQYLPSFIHQRYNFAIQNAVKFPNLHKIKVLHSQYSVIQLYQKQKYFRKKRLKNPYSNTNSKKTKRKLSFFNHQDFKLKISNNTSKDILFLIEKKFQKFMKNKQAQLFI